jgi:hypothetical protein
MPAHWSGVVLNAAAETLDAAPSTPKQQKEKHDYKDEVESATAVVADPGAHVIAASAEDENQNDEDDDKRHAAESSIRASEVVF